MIWKSYHNVEMEVRKRELDSSRKSYSLLIIETFGLPVLESPIILTFKAS